MTTPLYPTFEKRIGDAINQLIRKQVDPWSHLTAGYAVHVKRFDGSEISLGGGGFEGSPRDVFWRGYIEPYLEDLAVHEIAAATEAARARSVDATALLPEVQGLLLSGSRRVLQRMAETDRRLLGRGFPQNVSLRPIESEYAAVREFIDKHVRAELEMWNLEARPHSIQKEMEQKFGIVCSPRQAPADFVAYCKGLAKGASIGILFIDIDHFKALNSRFTEVVVDRELLRPFQVTLRDLCAHRAEVYRQGGEEFLLFLPNHSTEEVLAFAERARRQVAEHEFQVATEFVNLTVSIGVSLYPQHGDKLEALTQLANAAEHQAKERGRNRVHMHGEVNA